MAFRNPDILYALLALLIPLIIHLFNFRRYTTIYFSSVERLLSIQKDTRSKSKLKNLLILLSRLLLFAALILAFAGPYIPTKEDDNLKQEKIIGICLDNSFSMQAVNENGVLLDQAIHAIHLLLDALPAGQKLLFFTNDPGPVQTRILSREQFIKLLSETSYSARNFDAEKTIDQFNRVISSLPAPYKLKRELWLFSDFQENSFSIADFQLDSTLNWKLFPFSPLSNDNLSIDSCWFDQLGHLPNEPEILKVRITNHSPTPLNDIPLRLFVTDSLRAVSTVSLKGNEQLTAELNYQLDHQTFVNARIELDDYPVTFDNSMYYTYTHNQKIRVVEIAPHDGNLWKNLFGVESYFDYQLMNANSIDYSELEQCNLIILNALPVLSTGLLSKIKDFAENGTSVIFIPNMKSSPESWNLLFESAQLPQFGSLSTTRAEVSLKSFDHPSLKKSILSKEENPRLPYFQQHFDLKQNTGSGFVRILFSDQSQLFSYTGKLKSAQLLTFTSEISPEYTNLAEHPLFLPLVYNFAFSAVGYQEIYQTIGHQMMVELPVQPTEINKVEISEFGSAAGFFPTLIKKEGRIQLQVAPMIKKAGNYQIKTDGNLIATSAWNYQRKESDLNFIPQEELRKRIEKENFQHMQVLDLDSPSALNELSERNGIDLWRWFVIAALIFLIFELLLVRFFMNRDS